MYLNNIEKDFIEFYVLKYRDFAKDLDRDVYNKNEELLRNSLKLYIRMFDDTLDLMIFNDIVLCDVQCKKYVTDYVKSKAISNEDRKEKDNLYRYFEVLCRDNDYYQKTFSSLRSFVENIMY